MGRELYQCLFIWQMLLSVHGQNCPFPWLGYDKSKSCYYFAIHILKSWSDAQNFCRAKDGQLLKIDNRAEETWIMNSLDTLGKSLIGEQEWWTALKRDPRDINKWIWADNSQADTNLIRWGQGEPNNYLNNEHCAEIWSSSFNDKSCDMKLNYVCERSRDIPVRCDINSGWEYHDGKCYRYFNIQLTREQALLTCTGNQAELMSITTAGEQETATLVGATNYKDIWLSRVYLPERLSWMIMSYPGIETPNNLFYWQKNEPDIYQGVQNCAALNYSAEFKNNWYAVNCTELNTFVCQKPAGLCAPGFIQFQNRCYLFKQDTRLNWKNAKEYCGQQNSSLLEMQSSVEEHFISNYIWMQGQKADMVWIGLVAKRGIPPQETTQNLDDWFWISKNGYFSPMYLNMDMPSVLPNSCAYFYTGSTNKWFYNLPCNTSLPFVCYQYTSESNETRNPIPTTTAATSAPTSSVINTASLPAKISSNTGRTLQTSSVKAITTTTKITRPAITTTEKPVTWDPLCGMFWEKDANSDNCYMVISQVSTWNFARKFCQSFNGELLSVTTVEEQYYLAGRFRQFSAIVDKIWIGAHSRGSKAGWQWTDGSPFAFFNFLKGEPNDKDQTQQCVAMDARYSKWSDELCSNLYPFACKKTVNKKTMPNIPPTSPPFTSDDEYFGCQNGWSEYKLSCYLVVRNKTNWNQANSYCSSIGAGLVSMQNEAERDFVLSQLPKSTCYNTHINDDKCDEWESIGECSKNPVWMAKNCQKSCQSCLQECKDVYTEPECQHWANLGECVSNPKWMLKNCALSCGICDPAIYGGFWIGLNDLKREMWFTWSDGSDVTFTAWAKSQPNSNTNGQDCVTMTLKDGRWSDYTCTEFMPGFICKTPKKIHPKATRSPLSVGCENGSLGYNSMCYGFYEEKLSWDDAEAFCISSNGHLATVNDRYVQAFLASQIVGMQGSFWIGLTQSYDTGLTDQWQDGQAVQFTHWSQSHTGKIEEDGFCVGMATSQPVGLWETMNCTTLNSFICEFSRIGFTKPSPTTVTSTTTEALKCNPGWKEKGSFCYKMFDERKTWLDAKSSCIRIGGNLVSIHSEEEGQFLFKNFSSGECCIWIGFSDRDIEGGFKWSDGTPTDYTNWRNGEPNDAFNNEDCALQSTRRYYWNDDICSNAHLYICKVLKGLPVFEDATTTSAPTESCGKNSTWVYKNGKCYYFKRDNKPRTWYEAREYCMSQGGDLPSIHSNEDYNFIIYQTSINSLSFFWIGLNELGHKGFKWSDQSAVNFLAWGRGEPQNTLANKKCVGQSQWSRSVRWFSKICTYKFLSIVCARNKGSSNPVTMATTTVSPGGCPDGFSGVPSSNKCYKVVNRLDTRFNAEKACNAYGTGSHLASINNEVENAFLITLVRNIATTSWIGLHSMGDQRLYSWQDNSKVTYTSWAKGEPNGGVNEKCVEFYSSEDKAGDWNDVGCWRQRTYICQTSRSKYFPTNAIALDCPSGYQEFSSSCYKLQTTKMDWDSAQSSCQIDSANLVSINDIYEQSFIDVYSQTITEAFWIGLMAKNSTDLTWVDGWPYRYSRWADNEPSLQPDEKCTIVQDGKWKDTTCKLKLYSMCEKNSAKHPTTPIPRFCESGYNSYNGYCYYVEVSVQKTWVAAQSDCVKRNMNLVSVKDEAELEYLRNLVTKASGNSAVRSVWIGLTRKRKVDGSLPLGFYWQDGSELGYANWFDREPSAPSKGEECTEMHRNGRWNDINCYNFNRPYICKAPEGSTTTQSLDMLTSEWTSETIRAESSNTPVPTILPSSSKASNSFPSNPLFPQRQSPQISKIDTDKATSLTPGQVVGICIGVVFLICIIGVIGFLIWNKKKGASYNSEKQDRGFTNAMYVKSTENVSTSETD